MSNPAASVRHRADKIIESPLVNVSGLNEERLDSSASDDLVLLAFFFDLFDS